MNTISCVDGAVGPVRESGWPAAGLNWVGAVRDEIQFYATGARPTAQEMALSAAKCHPLGPHDGDAGIRKDVAMVADMREKCGPDFWLMLDCWMSRR